MKCEMCNENMNYNKEGSVQGFRCPVCGNWGVITTFIDEIFPSKLIIFPIYTIKSFQNCFCVAMFRCCSGLYKKFCSKA